MAKATKLPSGNWRVQAKVTVAGKSLKRSFTAATAKEAERMAEKWQSHTKMIGKDYTLMTVKEAMLYYIELNENDLSPPTVKEYTRIATNDMQDIINKQLYVLTCPIIKTSMNNACETLSPKTVKNRYSFLKTVLTRFHPTFVWDISFPKIPKKKKRAFSDEYITSICRAIKGQHIELEVYLGMLSLRASEIAALKWEDMNEAEKSVDIWKAKVLNKKGEYVIVEHNKTDDSTRTVYIPDYVWMLLMQRKQKSESKFISAVSPGDLWDMLNTILERNNIEHLRFHDLRHIYSSLSASLKIDNEIRKANGGWSSEKIMDGTYRHPMSEAQIEANQKMNEYFGKMNEGTTKSTTIFKKRLKIKRFA